MTKKKNRETGVISGVVAPKEKTLEVKPPLIKVIGVISWVVTPTPKF